MKLLLDSNVFRDTSFLKLLISNEIEIYLPTIVELEQYFYALIKRKPEIWNTISRELSISVIPFIQDDARLAASYTLNFLKHPKGPAYFFRDCIIGATSTRTGLILVTENIKDFKYLSSDRLMNIEQCVQYINSNF